MYTCTLIFVPKRRRAEGHNCREFDGPRVGGWIRTRLRGESLPIVRDRKHELSPDSTNTNVPIGPEIS